MRALLAFVLLALLPTVAAAQPICYPLIDATAHPRSPVIYHDGQGAGMGWFCRDGAQWRRYMMFVAYTEIKGGRVALSSLANAESQQIFSAPDPKAAAALTYARLTATALKAPCDQQPTTRQAVCNGLARELAKYTPVTPVYKVRLNPNRADGSRPISIVLDDNVTRQGTGRYVAAGTACDCLTLSLPSTGTDLWCRVNEQPREVAVCAAQ